MFRMYYAFNFNLLLFINVFEQLSRCTDIFDRYWYVQYSDIVRFRQDFMVWGKNKSITMSFLLPHMLAFSMGDELTLHSACIPEP